MQLSEVSISKPVLTIVMTIPVIIFGIVGYRYLGVREYPEMDPPIVTVTTVYTGANAEIIRAQITDPLEGPLMALKEFVPLPPSQRNSRVSLPLNSI